MMTRECKETARRLCRRLAPLLLLALAGAAAAADAVPGRVWSPDEGAFVPQSRVVEAVARGRFVLLGETHTKARHHVLQARMIRAAARDGRRPAVVLEMLGAGQQGAIDAWRRDGADPAAFGAAVGWAERGWPEWSLYRPIVAAAVELGLPLHGGAPAPAALRAVGGGGLAALEPARRAALGLDRPLPDPARARLERTLVEAHCGVPEHAPMERMLAVQRLRDASMAARLRATANGDGAVLIAGNGHARRDYGVAHYLAAQREGEAVVSVAFMAAGEGNSVADHRAWAGGTLAYDYVWFTRGEPELTECPDGEADG